MTPPQTVAAKLAWMTCETVTQKAEMKKTLNGEYMQIMGEARELDAIERGSTAITQDEYITVRI